MTIAEKLRDRLVKELDLHPAEDDQLPTRLRPGHWQRSAGAWSWDFNTLKGNIGSCETMSECIKAKKLIIKDGSIHAVNNG